MKLLLTTAAFLLVLLASCDMGEVAVPESGEVMAPIPMDAGKDTDG